jgi:hypothetical protein
VMPILLGHRFWTTIWRVGDAKVLASTAPKKRRTVEMDKKTDHNNETPSTTLPGVVQKVIPSPHPSIPEKAGIEIEGADDLYREIRIVNTLTDEHGNKVGLKSGAEVDVTIEADGRTH